MIAYAPLSDFSVADFATFIPDVDADDIATLCNRAVEMVTDYLTPTELVYLQQAYSGMRSYTVAKMLAVSEAMVSRSRKSALETTRKYLWYVVHRDAIIKALNEQSDIDKFGQEMLMLLASTRVTQAALGRKLHVSQQSLSQRFRGYLTECRKSRQPVLRDFAVFLRAVLPQGAGR